MRVAVRIAPLLVLLWTVLFAPAANATWALPVGVSELTRRADLIVDGDVAARQSFRIDGRIFTRVEVTVRDAWKGGSPRSVSVVLRGGVVDGIGQRVDGEAVLEQGDRAVLFLRYDAGLMGYRPVAMEQGAFKVAGGDGARPTQLTSTDVPGFERRVRELQRAR